MSEPEEGGGWAWAVDGGNDAETACFDKERGDQAMKRCRKMNVAAVAAALGLGLLLTGCDLMESRDGRSEKGNPTEQSAPPRGGSQGAPERR